MNDKKKNGKAIKIAEKNDEAEVKIPVILVVAHAGSRTFVGLTKLSPDEFDRRCSRGEAVELQDAVEIAHRSEVKGEAMMNLVSMTLMDHMLSLTQKLRVKPSSWYFVGEQDQLSRMQYAEIYGQTQRRSAMRQQEIVKQIAAKQKLDEALKKATEEAAEKEADEGLATAGEGEPVEPEPCTKTDQPDPVEDERSKSDQKPESN